MADKSPKLDRAEHDRIQKAVHDVVTNDTFLDALAETVENGTARDQFKADPKAHLKKKGCNVPDGVKVEPIDDPGSWGARVSMKGKNGITSRVEFRSGQKKGPETPKDRKRFHESMAEVQRSMNSDAALNAIEEASGDAALRAQAKADAKGFLKSRGVNIPDEAELKVIESPNPGVCWYYCWWWWIFQICVSFCITVE